MLHISEAIRLLNNKKPHNIKFVAKGSDTDERKGGYFVKMNNCVVTSSNYARKKFNVKSIDSQQIRWVYYILLVEVDGHEIFV